MSCVDNILTVCAPWPLFSLLRLLVGLQLKHGPLFIGSLCISTAVASPLGSAAALASLRKTTRFLRFRKAAELGRWHCRRWTVISNTSLVLKDLHLLPLPGSSVFSTPWVYKITQINDHCCSGHLNAWLLLEWPQSLLNASPIEYLCFTRKKEANISLV